MKHKIPHPIFSEYYPSFIHLYEGYNGLKKFTICIKTTRNIKVSIFKNKSQNSLKIFCPNLVYKGNLCVFENFEIDKDDTLKINLLSKNNEVTNLYESRSNYEFIDAGINFINSNIEYLKFSKDTLRRKKDERFLSKLHNSIYIRVKYIAMLLLNLFRSCIFTIKNIVVFLKTSRPK